MPLPLLPLQPCSKKKTNDASIMEASPLNSSTRIPSNLKKNLSNEFTYERFVFMRVSAITNERMIWMCFEFGLNHSLDHLHVLFIIVIAIVIGIIYYWASTWQYQTTKQPIECLCLELNHIRINLVYSKKAYEILEPRNNIHET